jgi:Na+-driven multidrug efflux pump
MIGQALGAQDAARARRCGHEGVVQCGLLTALVGAAFVVFATPLCALLNKDADVIALAAPVLMLSGAFQPLLAASIVYQGALRGAGDTVFPLVFSIVGLLLIRVPGGYLIGVWLGYGLFGAWVAVCIDMLIRAAMAFARFTRGRWTALKI